MLEERDGRCAVDDNFHLSAQTCQVSSAQATVLLMHIALHDNNFLHDSTQRSVALGVLLEEGFASQESFQPLWTCI